MVGPAEGERLVPHSTTVSPTSPLKSSRFIAQPCTISDTGDYFVWNCFYVGRHSYRQLKSYFSVQRLFILSLRLLKCARFEVLTAVLKIHICIIEIVYWVRTSFALIQKMRDRTTERSWLTPTVVCNIISFLASHATYWYRRSVIEGSNMALVRTMLLSSVSWRATLTELRSKHDSLP